MKEIGVGVIGFGFMGKMHCYGYQTIPLYYGGLPYRVKLVGICSGTEANAMQAKEELGFSYATTDASRILKDPNIQVVNICTPNNLHKDMVLQALQMGKHVYCDKPLTVSYAESLAVLRALDGMEKKPVTQMAMQMRCYPATMLAKKLIDADKIGRVLLFRTSYLHSSGVDPQKALSWKQDKASGGGGVTLDLGAHTFDLMYWLLGRYQSVRTTLDTAYAQRPDASGKMVRVDAEDTSITTVRMRSGALGTIENSKVATGTDDELRIEIYGEKGALSYHSMEPGYLKFYDNTIPEGQFGGNRGFTKIDCMQRYDAPGGNFPNPKFTLGFVRGHVHSLFNFLDHVYRDAQSSPSFADGAYVQSVLEQCYRSAEIDDWADV